MRRLLLPGFWLSVLGGAGAAIYAGATGQFIGFVAAGVSACLAVLAMAAMCWCDQGEKISLLDLALGRRPSPEESGHEVLVDVRAIQVAGVFVLARDFLVYLRGGSGSYSEHGVRRDWPEGADLFLAWRAPKRSTAEAARQLNAWEAAHELLHLLSVATRPTVLMDSTGKRLSLPGLSPADRGQAAHPGRR